MISAEHYLARPTLTPMLLLHGEEPFYRLKVTDAVRALARQQGYERMQFQVDAQTDWAALLEQTRAGSLFSSGYLIELEMPKGTPGREGSAFFRDWAASPPKETVLFLMTDRLEQRQLKSAWVQAFEQGGCAVLARAPQPQQLPQWCQQQAEQKGLRLDFEAAALLAERTEGNLLAADQALEILLLRYGKCDITVSHVLENVVDQAHYELFALSERILQGEAAEALHVFDRLLQEGVAVQLIIWILARDIRLFYQLSAFSEKASAFFKSARIWQSRQKAYQYAAQRRGAEQWAYQLSALSRADQQSKGMAAGSAEMTLREVILAASGATPLGHG